jgi:hypothetical protein
MHADLPTCRRCAADQGSVGHAEHWHGGPCEGQAQLPGHDCLATLAEAQTACAPGQQGDMLPDTCMGQPKGADALLGLVVGAPETLDSSLALQHGIIMQQHQHHAASGGHALAGMDCSFGQPTCPAAQQQQEQGRQTQDMDCAPHDSCSVEVGVPGSAQPQGVGEVPLPSAVGAATTALPPPQRQQQSQAAVDGLAGFGFHDAKQLNTGGGMPAFPQEGRLPSPHPLLQLLRMLPGHQQAGCSPPATQPHDGASALAWQAEAAGSPRDEQAGPGSGDAGACQAGPQLELQLEPSQPLDLDPQLALALPGAAAVPAAAVLVQRQAAVRTVGPRPEGGRGLQLPKAGCDSSVEARQGQGADGGGGGEGSSSPSAREAPQAAETVRRLPATASRQEQL